MIQVPFSIQRPPDLAPWPSVSAVPLPMASLSGNADAFLDVCGDRVPCDFAALDRWPDGTVRWANIRTILPPTTASQGLLCVSDRSEKDSNATADFPKPAYKNGLTIPSAVRELSIRIQLTVKGTRCEPRLVRSELASGGLSHSLEAWGDFPTITGIRWYLHVDYWPTLCLSQVHVTLQNSRRAKHQGGTWDLGDPNALYFDSFGMDFPQWTQGNNRQLHDGERIHEEPNLRVYQASSGGENWRSSVHVNHAAKIPCQFPGYQVCSKEKIIASGVRAEPSLKTTIGNIPLEITVPEFWQNFPSSLRCDDELAIEFFPDDWTEPHELQPGEQKTHSFVVQDNADSAWTTRTALNPPTLRPDKDWVVSTNATYGLGNHDTARSEIRDMLSAALKGERSFLANRERVDEFGWRHFGDIYADHENRHFAGKNLVVSHYNNQYDLVLGFMSRWLLTGNLQWWQLADELARHVVDIDIYHTSEDRAAYNGGMFWHTDHYQTAQTATHRTYSSSNGTGTAYGGGPSCEHNYPTGLLHYYYFSGRTSFKRAVVSLADWVIAMDDGRQSMLGVLCDLPTGLASQGFSPDYHGPSRGSGNSLNALLDGWLVTNSVEYLTYAETLIRRSVHPEDDIDTLGLLNAEARWSYTVFFLALGKYLHFKSFQCEDSMYEYAVASLIHYGRWMLVNECPYFQHREQLEYPTETWLAQDLRKANVLRLAAAWDADQKTAMLTKADEITETVLSEWQNDEHSITARSIAILLHESTREVYLRNRPDRNVPMPDVWPPRLEFKSQRDAVKQMFKSLAGWTHIAQAAIRPSTWKRILEGRGG